MHTVSALCTNESTILHLHDIVVTAVKCLQYRVCALLLKLS
jgi:hypothetical protein